MVARRSPSEGSGDDDFGHACDRRALGDEERELPQRVLLAGGLNRPPDRVAAGEARGQRRAVTERAFVTLEGRERDAALVRLVAVMDQEARHATSIPAIPDPDIGARPLSATLLRPVPAAHMLAAKGTPGWPRSSSTSLGAPRS